MINCLICGLGGQGIVLISKLLATVGMKNYHNVKTTETIGMAQRGGSVVSHIRMSQDPIHASFIPKGKADIIIGLELLETVRSLPYLKPNGVVITLDMIQTPTTSTVSYSATEMIAFIQSVTNNLEILNYKQIIATCGTAKICNVATLTQGMITLPTIGTITQLKEIVKEYLPPKVHAINLQTIEYIEKGSDLLCK